MDDVVVVEEVEGDRDDRSVSGRPGAEGAPRSRSLGPLDEVAAVVEEESLEELVLVVLVGWADEGAMRRDFGTGQCQ